MIEPQSAKDRIIVALDVPDEKAALDLVRKLDGTVGMFKIGLELFTAAGPSVVARVAEAARGRAGIFLDLKLHDIPNTVAGAVRAAARLGVDMLTIHLAGGGAMIRAAVEAAEGSETMLLGVSVLTSSTAETQRGTGADADIPAQVRRLVELGEACGLKGFVASPLELKTLRTKWPDRHVFVVPGVRPAWRAGGADDQQRVMSPAQAMAFGADYLVLGRPITRHEDPPLAAEWVANEMAGTII